jgi:MraZ protein
MGGTSAAPIGRPLPSVRGRALGEEVAMFLSTYVNKVDRKGRVSVPATFRTTLAAQRFPGIVVFPSFKYPALEANSLEWMEELANRLDTLDKFSDEHENLEMLFALSRELPFDTEGRIALPSDLAEHAAITDSVAFVGVGRSFQLWEPTRFAEHMANLRERARQQGTRIPALARSAEARRE